MLHGLGPKSIHRHDLTPIPLDKLYVVTAISNTRRFKSRYNLYRKFAKHIEEVGGQLVTVEVAYGERPFEITEAGNPFHVQLRTDSEIWHKENMLNIAISRLPSDWKYVAWVDSDVQFVRPDIMQETIHMLQHHQVVQMWSMAHDMTPDFETFCSYRSFMSCYQEHIKIDFNDNINWLSGKRVKGENNFGIKSFPMKSGYATGSRPYWHSGYAWAARREAIDHLGGLIDYAILGSGDHHMALGLIGEIDQSLPKQIGGRYREQLHEWQARAEKFIKRNVGFVSGSLNHYWHGSKTLRRYNNRWKVLKDHSFDPLYDLKRDSQGLWQLTDRSFKFRDDLRHYMTQRNEDSIDFNP